MTITLVHCDDWEGLYINEKKYDENHRLYCKDLFEMIRQLQARAESYNEILNFDFNETEIEQKYVEECGLPLYLSDIPSEVVE